MDSALQLISARVVIGYPEQRLSDLSAKISRVSAQYCAVLGSRGAQLVGLIRFSAVAARPGTSSRILSDLMSVPPQAALKDFQPADAAEPIMAEQGLQEIVVAAATGEYRGLITPESFTAWHLANERLLKAQLAELLAEQARLTDFLEEKVNAKTDEIRATLGEFETLCLTLSDDIPAPLQGLLERARRSFGAQARAFSVVDLNGVFADALQFLDVPIRERNAQVAAAGPLHEVEGYYFPLLQLFVNLIGNAVKSVQPNRRPFVMIWTEQTNEAVVLRVKDNGLGVPGLERNGPFQPAAARGKRPTSGPGLGLSIVHHAVRELSGRAEAAAQPDGGSLFSVILQRV